MTGGTCTMYEENKCIPSSVCKGLGGRIILKLIINKFLMWELDSNDSGYSPIVGFCEYDDEPLDLSFM